MLSNAYFLAKFRFDTAENEPAQNLQKFVQILPILTFFQFLPGLPQHGGRPPAGLPARRADPGERGAGPRERQKDGGELVHGDRPGPDKEASALFDRANLKGLVLGCIEAKFCK